MPRDLLNFLSTAALHHCAGVLSRKQTEEKISRDRVVSGHIGCHWPLLKQSTHFYPFRF
jgi:hypothetical protein